MMKGTPMTCIHTVSSCGKYNSTMSVQEENVLSVIDTMLSVLTYFGGGHVELYDSAGNLVNYFEV